MCSLLSIGCSNCTSASTCGSCDIGYVFLNNRCYLVVPAGYYNNSGIAAPCSSAHDCATCDFLPGNCTFCITNNLEDNTCVSVCKAGSVGVNKVCQPCTNNCRTCSGIPSHCTSCLANVTPRVYLDSYFCVETCPDYTYANSVTSTCTECEAPCELCSSRTLCLSCVAGSFLQGNSCLTECLPGFWGVDRVCQPCQSPCS